jgi:predicted  nucleic acid-binding Zn-ribbon protein
MLNLLFAILTVSAHASDASAQCVQMKERLRAIPQELVEARNSLRSTQTLVEGYREFQAEAAAEIRRVSGLHSLATQELSFVKGEEEASGYVSEIGMPLSSIAAFKGRALTWNDTAKEARSQQITAQLNSLNEEVRTAKANHSMVTLGLQQYEAGMSAERTHVDSLTLEWTRLNDKPAQQLLLGCSLFDMGFKSHP